MDALGAVAWLHDVLSKKEQLDRTQVVAAVQTALTLLGNAAAQISLERRKALMKHLNKDLRPLAGACYPKRSQWLFGEDFGLKAKNMADNVKALKPFAPKRKQFFRDDGGPNKKRHMVISQAQCHRGNGP